MALPVPTPPPNPGSGGVNVPGLNTPGQDTTQSIGKIESPHKAEFNKLMGQPVSGATQPGQISKPSSPLADLNNQPRRVHARGRVKGNAFLKQVNHLDQQYMQGIKNKFVDIKSRLEGGKLTQEDLLKLKYDVDAMSVSVKMISKGFTELVGVLRTLMQSGAK